MPDPTGRTTVSDLAVAVKSANAGAALLTFDLFFESSSDLRRASAALSADIVSSRYRVAPSSVEIYEYEPALALKITLPRPSLFGWIGERDFDGVQQHIPLLDVVVP